MPDVGAPPGPEARPRSRASLWRWWARHERLLFAALLALHVAPVWLVHHFPTRDGPAHLETTWIVLHYQAADAAVLRRFFRINLHAAPNWLAHLLLLALGKVLPLAAAEKLLVTLVVVGLPLSGRWALEGIRRGGGVLALLLLPFAHSWLLHMGFYSFCAGLPLFFVVVGFWARRAGRPRARDTLLLSAIVLLLYAAHPVPLVVAWAFLVPLCLSPPTPSGGHATAWRDRLRAAGHTLVACLPSAVLLAAFVGSRSRRAAPGPWPELLARLVRFDFLVTFADAEAIWAAGLAAAFAGLGLWCVARRSRLRRIQAGDGLLLMVPASVALYLSAPGAMAGGHYVSERLSLFPAFAVLFWAASLSPPPGVLRLVRLAAVILSTGLLAVHSAKYPELNQQIEEYLSAGAVIDPGSTMLPLTFRGPVSAEDRVEVTAHAGSLVAIARRAVELAHYEGRRDYFPLRFRTDVNPYTALGNIESVPPCIDLPSYTARTGQSIDYVITWRQPKGSGRGCAKRVLADIRQDYELAFVSEPFRSVRVWRLRAEPGE